MKPGFRLECIDVGQQGTLYTVLFDDQDDTELDRFLYDPECAESPDYEGLLVRLDDMLDRYGFQDRFFKPEGSRTDSVWALHYEHGPLRLYCCKWGRIILIAGYGGVKTTQTYQEDPRLDDAVERMQHVDRQLYHRIRVTREVRVDGYEQRFLGNLEFKPEDLI